MKDWHCFVVITPQPLNMLGVSMTVPITTGGDFTRRAGLAVAVTGHAINGVALCNQVRSFDIPARVQQKRACYEETLDSATMDAIIDRVLSAIDPAT